MTDAQWDEFRSYFRGSFPSIADWIAKSGPETAAVWKRVLISCEFQDAKVAVDALIDGKLQMPDNWSLIPSTLRRQAEKHEAARKPQPEPLPRQRSYKSRHSMADMFACIRESQKAGLTHDQSLAVLNERFPIEPEDTTPVRCLTCMDIGTVLVWSAVSVDAVRGSFPPKRYRSAVLCSCPAGRKVQEIPEKLPLGSRILPRYHETKFCKFGRGEVEQLVAWVEERKRNSTKEHPNYNHDFDSFGPDF